MVKLIKFIEQRTLNLPENNSKLEPSTSEHIKYDRPDPDQHSFKDWIVWQKNINFASDVIDLAENLETDRKHYRLIELLEAAVTSIPMMRRRKRLTQKRIMDIF